ncbi:MAG: oxaloacetate decarboxylase gamma subunit [Phenylobacterium sp.]|jgi:oxaloacetate decarboxylase gamma subunit
MDIAELLVQAGHLMLIGMLVVFVFLGLLVWVTKLLALIAGDEPEPEHSYSAPAVAAPQPADAISPQTVAAITAAIHQYRQSK